MPNAPTERPRWPSDEYLFWPRVAFFVSLLAVSILSRTDTIVGEALRSFARFIAP